MLHINHEDKRPVWQQLLDQAIGHITAGRWPPGEKLLPSRELAQLLGVSRSTIQIVYEELFSRGYTVTSRRGGTRVSEWKPPGFFSPDAIEAGPELPKLPELQTSVDRLSGWLGAGGGDDWLIDFSPHEPLVDEQLLHSWQKAYIQASARTGTEAWAYGDPYGYGPLREQIQRYLSMERGVHVSKEQILLTSGAQHSLDLIAQALLNEGDFVSVEDPGFPAVWMTMRHRNMRVLPVPVDDSGLLADRVDPRTRLLFATPSHQCAVGAILAEPRRQQLIRNAVANRFWIVEDDYDSEYRYRGSPLPTLFSQLPRNTLYMMSFSKMIAPGIRLSALAGPTEAIRQLARVQELTYRHLPIMEQMTLAEFMARGHFTRHMRRVRGIYRRRHEALTRAIAASGLGDRFALRGVETGSHLLLEADEKLDDVDAARRALSAGLRIYPLSAYCLESRRKGWVLGFPKVDEERIRAGMDRLAQLLLPAD